MNQRVWAASVISILVLCSCGMSPTEEAQAPREEALSAAAPIRCVQHVACIHGDRWDAALCKCAPCKPAVCEPVRCPAGEVFNRTQCACVGCNTAADCTGALPQLCELCADGSTACAHFACVNNACEIAICN